jgi:hypothetical protein
MDDISKEDIPSLVSELEKQGFVKLYAASTRQAVQMLDWWEVQKLQWAWPSDYPAPPDWRDRLRYKRGKKEVVTVNWNSGESPCVICDEIRAVESAHIIPQGQGSRQVIPLCPNHHKEYDKGLLAPEEIHRLPENARNYYTQKYSSIGSPESSPENSPERNEIEVSPESSPERRKIKSQNSKLKNQNSSIKNQVLISPENSGENPPPEGGPPGKGLFENLLEQIKSAPDGQKAIAGVGELYQVCAGRAPPYGRLGAIAKKVNCDYGYLAKLIWETAGKRPAGDLLDYVDGILRSKKGEEAKDKRGKVHPRKDFSGGKW